jgi:flagellar hook-associated protein 2
MTEIISKGEIGSKITQALKAGSGVNINELATSLANAESMAGINAVTKKKEVSEVAVSGYAVLKASVLSLQNSFKALEDKDGLLTHSVASSDEDMIDAEITSQSSAKAGMTRIQVLFVARPEVTEVTSNDGSEFTSATATISGLDKVHLAVNGGTAVQVNVLTPTPKGIVDAINAANVGGITARTLIKDSTGTKVSILVESKTGQANNFTITTNLSSELTRTQKQAAQDLKIKVNNLTEIYRDNNSPTDVVEGVQLKIKQTTGTDSHNIVVTASTSSLETSLESVIASYNDFLTVADYLIGDPDEDDKVAGSLSREKSTVNLVKNSIRGTLNTPSEAASNANFSTLRDLGISSKLGGVLSLDSTKFAAALKTNFTDIRTMLTGDTNNQFASDVGDHGLALDMGTALEALVSDTGSIKAKETTTTAAVAQYEEQLLDLTERLEGIKARYMKQFAAMETLVQRSKNTGSYLEGQFKAMESMYSN